MDSRRNVIRGYQKLRVWQDSIEYYRRTYEMIKSLSYEPKRVSSQQYASVDSVHRNIAEGYARRSMCEYVNFLYVSLSSLAESVSGLNAMKAAEQISAGDIESSDALAYKIGNGLIRLIQKLETKRDSGEWADTLVKEGCVGHVNTETYSSTAHPLLCHFATSSIQVSTHG